MKISGWARYPLIDASIACPTTIEEIRILLETKSSIARGNGRSYGDSAINTENTIDMRHFNRILDFDSGTGLVTVEAGVLLSDIIDYFLPNGWFPTITPGTKFVTVGGMVATDVHGKNHHIEGSFRNCVEWIELMSAEKQQIMCSREHDPDLFNWTIGGMGLTGVILKVCFRLKKINTAWIKQQTIACKNLDETINAFEANLSTYYSVAWIDCMKAGKYLGRSLITLGEHANKRDLSGRRKKHPFGPVRSKTLKLNLSFLHFLVSRPFAKLFNFAYYRTGKLKSLMSLAHITSFFYPLDRIANWNKIYGRNGFLQFQCAVPLKSSRTALHEIIGSIVDANVSAPLAVLKRFGKHGDFFSFPMEGYTLAVDFPTNEHTINLVSRLHEIVVNNGGRIYLAKDSQLDKETFRRIEGRSHLFRNFLIQRGCSIFSSCQSERIGL